MNQINHSTILERQEQLSTFFTFGINEVARQVVKNNIRGIIIFRPQGSVHLEFPKNGDQNIEWWIIVNLPNEHLIFYF